MVLDFYIQVQLSGTSGRKWRARSNHTPQKKNYFTGNRKFGTGTGNWNWELKLELG